MRVTLVVARQLVGVTLMVTFSFSGVLTTPTPCK